MKVMRRGEVPKEDATSSPTFVGGKVTRESLVNKELSKYYNFTIVSFAAGARNKFHIHSSDQVLYVTRGRGIVATEKEQASVKEGDTIFIPAGEKHWHGAAKDSDFAHISLTSADSKTQLFDEL
jgi:4-carboxymuconolactone decarboxylase